MRSESFNSDLMGDASVDESSVGRRQRRRHRANLFSLRSRPLDFRLDEGLWYGMVQGFEHGAANGTASTGVLKPRAERCGTQERLVPL